MYYLLLTNAHGGINPKTGEYVTAGKRSPLWFGTEPHSMQNIYYEGVGSRDINKKMVELNTNPNLFVKIINDTWQDTSIGDKRSLVMNEITKLDIPLDKVLVLETHSNATKEMKGKAYGSEFFTYIGQTKSDIFAEYLAIRHREAFGYRTLRYDLSDKDLDKEAKFGILLLDQIFHVPTVLSENGFMDNKKECMEILMTEEGRTRIANFQLKAAYDYFKLN